MHQKIKIIVSSIVLSLSLSSNNANAGLLSFAERHPVLTVVGLGGAALFSQSAMKKARHLSFHLPDAAAYFKANPQDFNPVAKYVLWALAHPADQLDYDRYKRLAQLMRLSGIPAYSPPKINNPNILTNPQQTENPANHILEHPIQQTPFSNIIHTPEGESLDTSTEFPNQSIATWEDYIYAKSQAKILADAMKANGMGQRQPGYAAHHIFFHI